MQQLFQPTTSTEGLIEARAFDLDKSSWYRTLHYIREGYNKECGPHSHIGRWIKRIANLLIAL